MAPDKPIERTLANCAIVLRATAFNPSIITPHWLVKKGICQDSEFEQKNRPLSSISTPEMCQIESNTFRLLVNPSVLQITPIADVINRDNVLHVSQVIKGIVNALPEIPYGAIGCNFDWHLAINNAHDYSRRNFYFEQSNLHREFDTADARYGVYLSKQYQSVRLKLDVKPVTVQRVRVAQPVGEPFEAIQYSFNFHKDFSVVSLSEIFNLFDSMEEFLNETNRLTNIL